jgi:hypothetical protein
MDSYTELYHLAETTTRIFTHMPKYMEAMEDIQYAQSVIKYDIFMLDLIKVNDDLNKFITQNNLKSHQDKQIYSMTRRMIDIMYEKLKISMV